MDTWTPTDKIIFRMRSIRNEKGEMPDDFYGILNEWALESVGVIALDTRLGTMTNPEASKISRVWRIYNRP